jgi:hypothetical protein
MATYKTEPFADEDESMVEADPMEMANKRASLDTDTGSKAMPRRPVSRPSMVTKEELDKSGMSLRDYMNAQQGLTRRKDTSSAPATKQTSDYSNEGRKKAVSEPTDLTKMSVSDRIKASKVKSREGTTDTRSVSERFRSTFGMAKGGSVSSASSRADGIAQRGKTRGKMC